MYAYNYQNSLIVLYFKKKFQNVIFLVLSDDIKSAKETLLIKENHIFDVVFPGDGNISSPGINLIIILSPFDPFE